MPQAKAKLDIEGTSHTLSEIKSMYFAQLPRCVGMKVAFNKWDKCDAPPEDAPPTQQHANAGASLKYHDDPKWIANQHGFVVGPNSIEKGGDMKSDGVFASIIIDSIDSFLVKQSCAYDDSLATTHVKNRGAHQLSGYHIYAPPNEDGGWTASIDFAWHRAPKGFDSQISFRCGFDVCYSYEARIVEEGGRDSNCPSNSKRPGGVGTDCATW